MVKGVTIRKREIRKRKEEKTKSKQERILGWQGIAGQLLDERGHCRRDDILDEADMRRQVAVTSMLVMLLLVPEMHLTRKPFAGVRTGTHRQ